MTRTAQPVQHDPGDPDARIVGGATFDHRGGRLRLTAGVDHQKHRPAKRGGDIGGRAGAARRAGHAVEQPHQPFTNHEVATRPNARGQPCHQVGRHRPAVEIHAGLARRRAMETAVDIIRTAFGAADPQAGPAERTQQAKRQCGLAAPGARGCDHKTGWRQHGHDEGVKVIA